jgi:hypothetical protein
MTTLYLLPIRNMDLRTREILGEANRWVKRAGFFFVGRFACFARGG